MFPTILSILSKILGFVVSFLSLKKYKSQSAWTLVLVIIFTSLGFTASAFYTNQAISNKTTEVQKKYYVDSLNMETIKKNTEEAKETSKRVENRVDFIYQYLLNL